MTPDHDPGREHVEAAHAGAEILEERREEREREEPEDDGGNAGQRLEGRLHDASRPRLRVLAQEDRDAEPDGEADEARPERDDERSYEQRLNAERGGLEERGPAVAREEVHGRDLAEELDRRLEQRDDDPDRRQDRDEAHRGRGRP